MSARMAGLGSSGPVGFHDVRETNMGIVFRTIREAAPCSRADIAVATSLNKATISSLVAQLIGHGVVREVGASSERRIGRPAVMLTLDDRWVAAVGLEVNVDYLTLVATDLVEREILSWHESFDAVGAGPEACAERLALLVRRALADPLLDERTVLGVTAAVPGLIDSPSGVVKIAPNLHWADFPLRDRLAELLAGVRAPDPPIFVDNDANLGAIAEYRSGHRAHTPDLIYLTGEVGIGAGILLGGELMRGTSGYGGEVGHIPLSADGPRCGCGRDGCLEAVAGIDAILRRAAPDLVGEIRQPLSGQNLAASVAATVERAAAGDATAREALHRAGTWLGRGAATLINLVNPRVLILGGYFVPLAPWLMPPCLNAVDAHVIAAGRGGCSVETSTLGLAAAARGGAAAAIDALDRGALALPAR